MIWRAKSIKNRKEQSEHIGHGEKSNIYVFWVPEREERENGGEALFEVMMAKNFPKVNSENKPTDSIIALHYYQD